jgi:hypothetical protein
MTAEENTQTEAVRPDLARLAEALLRYYDVTHPPVPVERMLREPPVGLSGVDLDQLSLVMEHGLYHYAPRLAMARLLCREIAHSAPAMKALETSVSPSISYADMKFFARCLLMPPGWVKTLSQQGLSVEQISTYLQVPTDTVITRLAELELPVPSTG